jgi:hypothetical protein
LAQIEKSSGKAFLVVSRSNFSFELDSGRKSEALLAVRVNLALWCNIRTEVMPCGIPYAAPSL